MEPFIAQIPGHSCMTRYRISPLFFLKFLLDRGPFCAILGTLCFGLRTTLPMRFKASVDSSSPALFCHFPRVECTKSYHFSLKTVNFHFQSITDTVTIMKKNCKCCFHVLQLAVKILLRFVF